MKFIRSVLVFAICASFAVRAHVESAVPYEFGLVNDTSLNHRPGAFAAEKSRHYNFYLKNKSTGYLVVSRFDFGTNTGHCSGEITQEPIASGRTVYLSVDCDKTPMAYTDSSAVLKVFDAAVKKEYAQLLPLGSTGVVVGNPRRANGEGVLANESEDLCKDTPEKMIEDADRVDGIMQYLGTCMFHTATYVFDAWRSLKEGRIFRGQTSPLELAYRVNSEKHNGFRDLTGAADSMLFVLDSLLSRGGCPVRFQTSDYAKNSGYSTWTQIYHPGETQQPQERTERFMGLGLDAQQVVDSTNSFRKGLNLPALSTSQEDALKYYYGKEDYLHLVETAGIGACSLDDHIKTSTLSESYEFDIKGLNNRDKYDRVADALDRMESPLFAGMCSTLIMKNPDFPTVDYAADTPIYQGSPECAGMLHALVLLGKKWDPSTKTCKVLVQNWWGKDPSSKFTDEPDFVFKKGKPGFQKSTSRFWIPLSLLSKYSFEVGGIRSKKTPETR